MNSALNFAMKERAQQGIGVDINQANLITEVELFVGTWFST